MKRHVVLKLWIIGALLFSIPSFASTIMTGTFTANKACQVYVSKNKRNNPDQTLLKIKKKYTIFEANQAVNPEWYRIRVLDANPAERWVLKGCGTVNITGGGNTPVDGKKCQTAGLEDSYKLALSWQPAFCETHRDKPEFEINRNVRSQVLKPTRHVILHYMVCGLIKNPVVHVMVFVVKSKTNLAIFVTIQF